MGDVNLQQLRIYSRYHTNRTHSFTQMCILRVHTQNKYVCLHFNDDQHHLQCIVAEMIVQLDPERFVSNYKIHHILI